MISKNKSLIKIGKNIRTAREAMNLTQLDVAEKSGVSVNYYAQIERGEVNMTLQIFESITQALRVKSSQILPY